MNEQHEKISTAFGPLKSATCCNCSCEGPLFHLPDELLAAFNEDELICSECSNLTIQEWEDL